MRKFRMRTTLKDHAIAFSCGLIAPPALVLDVLTFGKHDLFNKVGNLADQGNHEESADTSAFIGGIVGTLGGAATIAAATIMGVHLATQKTADHQVEPQNTHHQAAGNAAQGAHKIAETAASAGILVPQLASGPQ